MDEMLKRHQKPRFFAQDYWFATEWGLFKCPDSWSPGLFSPRYEKEVKRIVQSLKGGLFVDVGANIGLYSVMAARMGNRVVALEPNPHAFACLSETLAANGLQNRVQALRVAGWSENTTVDIKEEDDSTGGHVIGKGSKVRAMRLDTLLTEKPSLVKIDTEGAEPHVLMGMSKMLSSGIRIVFEALDVKHFLACQNLLPRHHITMLDKRNYLASPN